MMYSLLPRQQLHLFRRLSSQSVGKINQEAVHSKPAADWWKKLYPNVSPGSIQERQKDRSQTHVVFLEGPVGCGKTSMLDRLSRVGYTTLQTGSDSFSPSPLGTVFSPEKDSPLGTSSFLSMRWGGDHVLALESFLSSEAAQNAKENVVFVSRSLLTCSVYGSREGESDYWIERVAELKSRLKCSVIYCLADEMIVLERIAGRIWRESDVYDVEFDQDKVSDIFQSCTKKYDSLLDQNIIDEKIHTTDTKQGTASLFRLLGIGPSSVFTLPTVER